MKKLLSIASALLCLALLTGCGSEKEYTAFEQTKIQQAESLTTSVIVPTMSQFMYEGQMDTIPWGEFTMEEVSSYAAYIISYMSGDSAQVEVDGYGFTNAISSFQKGAAEVGQIVSVGDVSTVVDDDQIIVTADVIGTLRDGQVEVIFSNDMFMTLEAATLNINYTLGEKMGKAGLNTLIGMGTVFIVLILICGLISLFKLIPMMQAASAKKKAQKEAQKNATATGIENAVNQITAQETVSEDLSDDMELVAVIAAAIAAYEGSASADGVVVRSIRRIRR